MFKNNLINFLFIKVPICICICIFITELIAISLSNYRPIRHGLDRKVAEIELQNIYGDVDLILFGDSITKDIADEYELSPSKNILNFTTNRASGIIGILLLYKKYRISNKAPKHILIASTPSLFSFIPKGETKKLYISSVFKSDIDINIINDVYENVILDEEKFNVVNYINSNLKLSIFNLKYDIIYPFINFCGFINSGDSLFIGNKEVPYNLNRAELKNEANDENASQKEIKLEIEDDLFFKDGSKFVLKRLFKIFKNDGVKLHVAWAPLRNTFYNKITINGRLESFENIIHKLAQREKLEISFYDFSKMTSFPDSAFRGKYHLTTGYWSKHYAYLLDKNIGFIINMKK